VTDRIVGVTRRRGPGELVHVHPVPRVERGREPGDEAADDHHDDAQQRAARGQAATDGGPHVDVRA
jgi:hypothetical protein